MWSEFVPGLRSSLFATVLLGVVYPLSVTGICQVLFPHQANGSLITAGDKVIGSELIGQNFSKPEFFQPRPSSAGNGYDPTASSGSNLGLTSGQLVCGATQMGGKKKKEGGFYGLNLRIVHFCLDN